MRNPSSIDGDGGSPTNEPAVGGPGSDRWALAMWSLDSPDGADQVVELLARDPQSVRVSAAAVVLWPALSTQPLTRTLPELSQGVLGESFWGTFFGVLFFAPMVVAPVERVGGVFARTGIDDQFINRARDRMVPGTSALFLLTPADELYRLVDAAAQHRPHVLVVGLTGDQKHTLEATYATPR